MSKSLKAGLLVLMILTAIVSTAQAEKTIFAGVMLPQELFGGVAKDGGQLGLEFMFPVVPHLLKIGLLGAVYGAEFDFGELLTIPGSPFADYQAWWVIGEAQAVARVTIPLTGLYAKAGLGVNRYSIMSDDIDNYESQTYLSGMVGVGLNFSRLDLNAMYHIVKWDEDAENPETWEEVLDLDKSYSYFTGSIGIRF